MKSWYPKLRRLSRAMEFANIDTLRELEALLESRAPAVTAKARERAAPLEYRFTQTIDLCAFARRAAPEPSGLH